MIENKKTKIMLFNRAIKFDFMPKLTVGGHNFLEVVEEVKPLGIMARTDLKGVSNTKMITSKAYQRMWMLRN